MSKLRGLFDEQERLSKLSKKKDVLEQLNSHIDFEFFRKPLNSFFEKEKDEIISSIKHGEPNKITIINLSGTLSQGKDEFAKDIVQISLSND